MISKELIDKINRLWHKQQTTGLTSAEKEEQRLARQEYLAAIRGQVRGMLETLTKPEDPPDRHHSPSCSCEHCKQ